MNSVGDRLSQAQTVMSGDRSDSRNHMALCVSQLPPLSDKSALNATCDWVGRSSPGGGPAGQQRSVQIAPPPWSSQQNAADAHVSSDTSDRDAKRMWKIEWLTQKLENVETAHAARWVSLVPICLSTLERAAPALREWSCCLGPDKNINECVRSQCAAVGGGAAGGPCTPQ